MGSNNRCRLSLSLQKEYKCALSCFIYEANTELLPASTLNSNSVEGEKAAATLVDVLFLFAATHLSHFPLDSHDIV